MKRKPPKPDDPEQSKRFVATAREVGADETQDGARRTFKKVARPRVTKAPVQDAEPTKS